MYFYTQTSSGMKTRQAVTMIPDVEGKEEMRALKHILHYYGTYLIWYT